jgi:hypothetical protein
VVRGAEHISITTVDSLDLIVAVLQSYRADDGRWTTLVDWEDEVWEEITQGRGPVQGSSILIRLEPEDLDNPDLDIRYTLPDLIAERSHGLVTPDGYDYAREDREPGCSALVLYLWTEELKPALDCVLAVIQNEQVLGNDLRKGTTVAVATLQGDRVVYPPGFRGRFVR